MTLRRTAALVALAGLSLVAACSQQQAGPARPPAQIRAWEEPPETAGAEASAAATPAVAVGRLSASEVRELTSRVRLVGVGFAGDGGYVIVRFKAPPRLAANWQPGRLWVTDEATGAKYDDIPQMPLIGALLGRPASDGQLGYVMFVNTKRSLRAGAKVTVILDTFRAEHRVVE